ncbi:drebrin [Polypterus senegalus]|uniref:drebrin n=1 Tax=Polypterus senegalus TaxID=55291 RepID=UPI0019653FE2|nr:drebrin [Polypterus senegalus]
MPAIDLDTYSLSLITAKEDIQNPRSSTNWALFSYEGFTNKVKLTDSGAGGVAELAEKFNSSRAQYGLCRVDTPGHGQPMLVMINWIGDSVDENRRVEFASHVPAIKTFFKEAHVFISARSPAQVTPDAIQDVISKIVPPSERLKRQGRVRESEEIVGTNYRKTNAAMEMRRINRDSFWARAEREEERRKEEDRRRNLEEHKRWERERMLQEKREADERERKLSEKEKALEEQRRIQAKLEAEERRREKAKWEQQQREHEEEMRNRYRRSESIEKAAEAAALVSQRTMNPREFFRQLSSSSSSSTFCSSPRSPGTPTSGKSPFRRYQRSLTDTAFIFGKPESPISPRSPKPTSPVFYPSSPFRKASLTTDTNFKEAIISLSSPPRAEASCYESISQPQNKVQAKENSHAQPSIPAPLHLVSGAFSASLVMSNPDMPLTPPPTITSNSTSLHLTNPSSPSSSVVATASLEPTPPATPPPAQSVSCSIAQIPHATLSSANTASGNLVQIPPDTIVFSNTVSANLILTEPSSLTASPPPSSIVSSHVDQTPVVSSSSTILKQDSTPFKSELIDHNLLPVSDTGTSVTSVKSYDTTHTSVQNNEFMKYERECARQEKFQEAGMSSGEHWLVQREEKHSDIKCILEKDNAELWREEKQDVEQNDIAQPADQENVSLLIEKLEMVNEKRIESKESEDKQEDLHQNTKSPVLVPLLDTILSQENCPSFEKQIEAVEEFQTQIESVAPIQRQMEEVHEMSSGNEENRDEESILTEIKNEIFVQQQFPTTDMERIQEYEEEREEEDLLPESHHGILMQQQLHTGFESFSGDKEECDEKDVLQIEASNIIFVQQQFKTIDERESENEDESDDEDASLPEVHNVILVQQQLKTTDERGSMDSEEIDGEDTSQSEVHNLVIVQQQLMMTDEIRSESKNKDAEGKPQNIDLVQQQFTTLEEELSRNEEEILSEDIVEETGKKCFVQNWENRVAETVNEMKTPNKENIQIEESCHQQHNGTPALVNKGKEKYNLQSPTEPCWMQHDLQTTTSPTCIHAHSPSDSDEDEEANGEELSEEHETMLCARAIHSYQADDDSKLSLQPGDVIRAVEIVDQTWCWGYTEDGRQGLFPATFVEKL